MATDRRLRPVYQRLQIILQNTRGEGRIWNGLLKLIEFVDELARREAHQRLIEEIHEKVYTPWLERQLEELEQEMTERA